MVQCARYGGMAARRRTDVQTAAKGMAPYPARLASARKMEINTLKSSILENIGKGRYRLRADWTASFFEAAGFIIDGTRDFTTLEEAVAALAATKTEIAVITSDDATYLEIVASLAAAVKAACPSVTLLVAGAPGDNESAWRAAGVDDFVNVRSNNYELNLHLLKIAGVL